MVETPENLVQLVEKDFYQEKSWLTLLHSLAGSGNNSLESLIPPLYGGNTVDDRINAYAADMARKVRVNFPNEVIGRMIEKNDLRLGRDHETIKKPVQTFLKNAVNAGFALGKVPLNTFISDHKEELFKGIDEADQQLTVQNIKILQRLYQVTPTNEALSVLLDQGFTSASQIAALSHDAFTKGYGHLFPSQHEAEMVYKKADHVSAVTYSFCGAVQHEASSPALYATSPASSSSVSKDVQENLLKHYPNMETLFGSLDYCECEHCRSVLSPAAYFVDLLHFIDVETNQKNWDIFLNDWQKNHNNELYQSTYKTPYGALIQRRPDLPYLSLTCENTNTELPYIDLVNEILEYYVAFNQLTPEAAQDTGTATTGELLAEPHHIIVKAYDILKEARYPVTLPFDFWLETVRQFFAYFQIPLWEAMKLFRQSEDLMLPAADLKSFLPEQLAIFAEQLSISPAAYAIFTSPAPLADWYRLYGYPNLDQTGELASSAKNLSRRLGVSYKELIDLVRTGFVNPQINKLAILSLPGIETADVVQFKKRKYCCLKK